MDRSYNDDIRPLLDLNDSLPSLLKGKIDLPIIASCGMQSHGKSSTLESITHISLPNGDGTVTICPIKISLRNTKEEEFARIKFELDTNDKYEPIRLDEISEKILEYQNKVRKENNFNENEKILFDKVIQVEVNRKNAPNLTLYDMPGFSFDEKIKEKSKEINEKFLKDKKTTVLLVISGTEDVTNSYATDWMRNIPDYKKRFIAVITKADFLKEKNINNYLKEINNFNLENPPALLVNKCKKYEKLSYDEMEKEEISLINQIPDIDKHPNVNKGIQSLIRQLIEIQKKDLLITFSDIASKIKNEIEKNENMLKTLPSQCKSLEEFFWILEDCLTKFHNKIQTKKDTLKVNKEDGSPKENLLIYQIKLKFIAHIKKVKQKINELLSLPFCNQVYNNIIQYRPNNNSILEDDTIFSILTKPKIQEILSDFDITINDVYEYMIYNINPLIAESFGNYELLRKKVSKLYQKYAKEQKQKMLNFYKEIKFLETENISTFDSSISDKVNNINKHINFILFGEKKSKKFLKDKSNPFDKIIKLGNNILNPINFVNDVKEKLNPINQVKELSKSIKEVEGDEFYETNEELDEKKEELNDENNNMEINLKENEEKDDEFKAFKIINDLNSEVKNNKNFGEIVKEIYQRNSELIKSEIINNYDYEREKKVRFYEKDEFTGRIKIAYIEQDIETFYERLIDENIIKATEDNESEFIPGFQYINKEKLIEFHQLISDGKVQIKTANLVTKMMAYLEVMLNRNLDLIFLSIQKYLYDKLTDDDMIKFIRNKIHILEFKECRRLVEEKQGLDKQRNECESNLKNLKDVLKKIRDLKFENMVFLESEEEDEEKNEEEEEAEKDDEKNNKK